MTLSASLLVGASALAGTIHVPDDISTVDDAVLAAEANDTIVVAAGDYPLSGTLMLTNGVKLTGAGAGVTTLYRPSTAGNFELVVINHAQSVLDGFTLTNGVATLQTANIGTGGVRIDADGGTIRNCRVAFCTATTFYANGGITINSADGHAENCEVDHCRAAGTLISGGGITVTGGTVTGCLVHDNEAGKTGCGIYVGDKAKVGECTVVRNTTTGEDQNTGGIYISKNTAIVSNCVMWANMSYGRTTTESFDWGGQASSFRKCATPDSAINGNNFRVDTPGFADQYNNDFTPIAGSPLIGAGYGGVDIGARQSAVSGFTVGFVVSRTKVAAGHPVRISVRLHNEPAEGSASTVLSVMKPSGGIDEFTDAEVEYIPEEVGDYAVSVTATKGAVTATPTTRTSALAVVPASVNVTTSAELLAAYENAADGSEIRLAAGDYSLDQTLTITKGVKLAGAGRDVTTLRRPSTATALYNVLTIRHAEAVVSGLSVTGGKINAGQANGVWIMGPGGRLEDCGVWDNDGSEWWTKAGAIYLITSGGVVSRCAVSNNTCSGQSATSAGIYMRCGRVENTLVCDNIGKNGGGIGMAKGGAVRNCTIVNNTATVKGGGIYVDCDQNTTRIVNCIIDSNTCTGAGDTSVGKPNWTCSSTASEKYFYTNATSAAVGVGTITEKPVFASDWSLDARSAGLIDHGADLSDIGDYDLALNARKQGSGIDIGCFEHDASQVQCGVVWSPQASVAVGTTVTLKATGIDALNPTAWQWTVTDPSGAATVYETKDVSFAPNLTGAYTVSLHVTTAGGEFDFTEDLEALTVLPKEVFVSLNGSPGEPYASWETATTNIHDALCFATLGTTVYVDEGLFAVTNEIELADKITVCGVGRMSEVVLRRTDAVSHRIFHLNHPDAVVTNLTLTNGRIDNDELGNYGKGGGVMIDAGTLTDCLVVSNYNGGFYGSGCGIALQGVQGKVLRCAIGYNRGASGYPYAGGIYMTAGVVENCLIFSNGCQDVGGIYVDGTGEGRIRNCTVVCNRAGNPPGGKDMACGLWLANPNVDVENTIVRDNVHTVHQGTDKELEWSNFHFGDVQSTQVAEKRVKNCCLSVACGSGCVTDDPCFRSGWRILAKSPCRDKGLSTLNDWARGTVDLDGKRRLVGYGVDMGCFENQSGGLQVIVR